MYAVIFPYVNEMMHDFGVPQKSVGLWSAAAESALMVTEAITAPMYAPLADRYGRRAVFIPLVALWGVFSLAFGFASNAVTAVLMRALLGLLAGAGVISRTILGELCDKSNRIQCFALFSPSFTIGVTIAPIIGGFLSKPVPRLLPESFTLFVTYPYLLPAIAASATGFAAAWTSYLTLPETLPPSLRTARGSAAQTSEGRKWGGLGALVMNKAFQNVLLLYGLANMVQFSWEAIYPLFAFTDKNLGGLQLSTPTIGVLLALGAGLSITLTIFLFPVLHRIVPENSYLGFCLVQYPIAVLLFPVAWAANKDYPVAGRLGLAGWAILFVQLILRRRDRERPVYNLKEALMARCYIEVLGLDKHSEAAQRLIKWKQPVEGQREGFSGDFARVCYQEIAARSVVEEGTLSVDDVNSILDDLAKGRMKQHEYVPILRRINEQCTAVQQEWIIRIILKDLRISFKEKGVLGAFHPDAMALFNVCSDLKRVCWTLYEPEIRLEKNFIMEEKLDGERIQLHMRGNGAEWFYCSRKAKDYTYLYGAHVGEGSLTQYISGAFQDGVRNIILDGEMMVWDPILDKYLAFGSLKTAALDNVADQTAPRPCFKVFDILYLNGKCLTGSRLSERKRLLKSGRVFRDLDNFRGRLEFVDERLGQSGKDIRDMLESVLESKGEGIVVKRVDSTYQTNSRGADWVKVKPEYADQMGENLDLMVLGGWWGQGGRTGKISSLLCGLRVPQEDDGSGETPAFVTFAKVGSGMSYEDYDWIKFVSFICPVTYALLQKSPQG
ncbi:DNA ligase (ATP) [Vanrija albida]|uniref:DNA ligase n=1 Tax=Vanrija albida TaxID=181172 RepID=A0ABR3QF32_9TREE